MPEVSFTRMADGTREEYELLTRLEGEYAAHTGERVLAYFRALESTMEGYRISRQEHGLQAATRALRDGAEEEMVVAALLHDIGDSLAPFSHSEFAAAILRPYVSDRTHWVVQHHGVFQCYYYAHHMGGDRHARDRYRDHPFYADCVDFCERWDQSSFDPGYESLPLEHFEPMVLRVFARKPREYERE
jgi:predicted HD phosphohydrolase